MSSGKRTKDRHVSGTGRSDSDKRGGGGSFAWGKAGEDAASSSSSSSGAGDPNNAGGAFQARLEGRAGDYFEARDTSRYGPFLPLSFSLLSFFVFFRALII